MSLSLIACRKSDPAAPCPAGFAADEARAQTLWERLGASSAGARLIARSASKPPICFGQTEISNITTTGVMYFDDKLAEPEAAARLGHLFLHFVDGMPMANPRPEGCDKQVDEALRAESIALSFELQLRREFAVTKGRIGYLFEERYWAAVPDARESLILEYLYAHPNGAPGIDALAAAYTKRCREAVQH